MKHNENAKMQMFSRFNVYYIYHLSLACYRLALNIIAEANGNGIGSQVVGQRIGQIKKWQ